MKNLMQKWIDFKCAVRHGKFARRLTSLLLAGAMIIPVAFIAGACAFDVKDNGDGSYTVTPKPNGSSGDQGGNTGSSAKPAEPDYSMYSPLLQDVLKSDYYNDFAEKAINKQLGSTLVNGIPSFDGGNNLIEPIPYRFLQNEGLDIAKIKSGDIRVDAFSYSLGNDNILYHKVDVTHKNNSNNYTTQYLLKYNLTEQEFKDLKMLNQNKYIQAAFFIQELDNQREPEVVGKFNIDTDIHNKLLKMLNRSKKLQKAFNKKEIGSLIIKSCTTTEENDVVLDCLVMPASNSKNSFYNNQMTSLNLLIYSDARPSFNNGILSLLDCSFIYNQEVGEVQDITCFDPYYSRIQSNSITKNN